MAAEDRKEITKLELEKLIGECFDQKCELFVQKTIDALERGKEVKVSDVAKKIEQMNREFLERQKALEEATSKIVDNSDRIATNVDDIRKLTLIEKRKREEEDKKLKNRISDLITGISLMNERDQNFKQEFLKAVQQEIVEECPNCGFEKERPYLKEAGKCPNCGSIYSNVDKARKFRRCAGCGAPIQWKTDLQLEKQ